MFAAGLAVAAALYYWTDVPRVLLFWVAFILTRPLGATLGDFLDKPLNSWRARLEPPNCVGSHCGNHDRLHRLFSAKSGQPSGREPGVGAGQLNVRFGSLADLRDPIPLVSYVPIPDS